MTVQTNNIQKDAINLVALFNTIWLGKKQILKIASFFVGAGLILSFLIPKEYTATSSMVPQTSDPKSKLGSLSGLAAMAGINVNLSEENEITPKIYPQIILSPNFQLEIMNAKLNFAGQKEQITLFQYYTEIRKPNPIVKYTINLPWVIIKAIKGKNNEIKLSENADNPIGFTDEQVEVQKIIKDKILITADEQNGYITLSCQMPEAVAAAQLTQYVQQLLKKYITQFKTEKAKSNEEFVQERFNEAEKNYEKIQGELALFRDRNKNFTSSVAKTELEKLTNKYSIANGVYGELAKKLEQAKIQVKEKTPVFTIVQQVMIPSKKSKPNRPMIIIIFILIGTFAGTISVTSKEYFKQIKEVWNEGKNSQSENKC